MVMVIGGQADEPGVGAGGATACSSSLAEGGGRGTSAGYG